jgi:hypothetical protein
MNATVEEAEKMDVYVNPDEVIKETEDTDRRLEEEA